MPMIACLAISAALLSVSGACGDPTLAASDAPPATLDDAASPHDAAATAPSDDATVSGDVSADAGDGAAQERILFDGTSTASWKMAGLGSFILTNGALVAQPGNGLGLYWHSEPAPRDYVLSLEWKLAAPDDNSGVVLRFPDPNSKGYENTAWVGVHFGFEVQIDELGRPDGANVHKTGAIYEKAGPTEPRKPAKAVGEWNKYELRVEGTTFAVRLNGDLVTTWSYAGAPPPPNEPRYVGLQAHTGNVAFRNVRLRPL